MINELVIIQYVEIIDEVRYNYICKIMSKNQEWKKTGGEIYDDGHTSF